ncbi:unnamed protein product [Cyclocybe aegerita]|uniref:Uncharacterized protein n=1 Tax=Cyclocybe aegerita TaxID=1973307 RepID=A0A8S0XRP3_CYCAE|nr:unnamed protein product [Cyclocybe aegerita]
MTLLLPPPTLHALPHQRPCPFTAPPHDLNLTENATALQSRPFLLSPARFSEDDCHDDDDESEVEDICHPSPGSDTYDGHVSEATSTANHSINNMEFPGARKNDGEASAVEADEGPNSGEISGLSLMENRDDDSDIYCTPSPPPMPMQSRINVHSLAVKQEDASEEDVSDILGPPEAGSSRHGSAGTPDAVSTPITWKLDTAEEVLSLTVISQRCLRIPTTPIVGSLRRRWWELT